MAPSVIFCIFVIAIFNETCKVALVHNPVTINANKLHRINKYYAYLAYTRSIDSSETVCYLPRSFGTRLWSLDFLYPEQEQRVTSFFLLKYINDLFNFSC
jgi:hypothetical protein